MLEPNCFDVAVMIIFGLSNNSQMRGFDDDNFLKIFQISKFNRFILIIELIFFSEIPYVENCKTSSVFCTG
jgi:hypothetical protein